MNIDEFLREFLEGSLRINCRDISLAAAEQVSAILADRTGIKLNDDEFCTEDGYDYCSYILHYNRDFPLLGTKYTVGDGGPYVVMFRRVLDSEDVDIITAEEFIDANDAPLYEVDEVAFNDLFA